MRTRPWCRAGSRARIRPQMIEPFPAPVAPAISRWVPCSRMVHGAPSSRRPTGSARRSVRTGMGRGGDDGGQGVAADELQHQQPGTAGTDPAGQRGEPVRQAGGPAGEVLGRLTGHDAHQHPVHIPGRGDLAEHRQQQTALVGRGQAADGHHRGPVALVVPAPPLTPGRAGDEPVERTGPAPPPPDQGSGGDEDQDDGAGPACRIPGPGQ